jgi:hypothetical protein
VLRSCDFLLDFSLRVDVWRKSKPPIIASDVVYIMNNEIIPAEVRFRQGQTM